MNRERTPSQKHSEERNLWCSQIRAAPKQVYKLLFTLIVLLFYLLYSGVKGKFHQQFVYFLALTFLIAGICWLIDFGAVKSRVNFGNDWFNLIFVGGIALCLYSFHCFAFGIPLAQNQDDYSYLLMAKTFAQGRLTNPAHPMREFFDNLNIINYPTFTSKYLPAQGLVLALGILLFQSPFAGVLLSGVGGCMASFWILRAFFPPKWSFFGAFLTLTHPAIFSWILGYHFGFVACIGATLSLGALFRLSHTLKITYAAVFAVGIAILANSRPFEGLIACVPMFIFVVGWFYKQIKNQLFFRQITLKFIVPVTLILLLNFFWMAFYNYKVTGDALKLPYTVYNDQYDPIPLFLPLFSPPKVDEAYRNQLVQEYETTQITRNRLMREFHLYEFDNFYIPLLYNFINYHNSNVFMFALKKGYDNFVSFSRTSWFVYSIILLAGGCLFLTDKKFLFFSGALGFCFFADRFATYNQDHYFAPFVGYLILLITFIFFQTSNIHSILNKFVTSFALTLIIAQVFILFTDKSFTEVTFNRQDKKVQTVFEKDLYELPGEHLVLIDFSTGNYKQQGYGGRYLSITDRTYFNEPDIDNSKVVWANSLGEEKNKNLFDYFSGREIWVLGFGANKLKDGTVEPRTEGLYPQIISCGGIISEHKPELDLENTLLQLCPK
jgi:hypothetical protein